MNGAGITAPADTGNQAGSATCGAGLAIALHLGQRVRHRDFKGQRVTGVIRGLSVDSENALHAEVVLDEAIVLAPLHEGDREVHIRRQHIPAHELAPFDEREELIGALLYALRAEDEWRRREAAGALDPEWDYEGMVGDWRRAAIAMAGGSVT